jgi:hypothetical protein
MVKEKVNGPASMTSDDDMDLLDDNEALFIKDGSPPLTDMDINMVFMLSAKLGTLELGPMSHHFTAREEELFEIGTLSFERLVTLLHQGVEGGL